jgi:redox-sensitive bicupin YhaK (pirin superfamily)
MRFGVLRVLNDDLVQAGTGFDLHPHRDMEIISYVVDGELTHGDSMGNRRTLYRGEVQYMSAGTGVYHSEHNLGSGTLRFLQIWIFPDRKDHTPSYGDYRFKWEDRINTLLPLVSPMEGSAPVKIHQDVHLYASYLEAGRELSFSVGRGRQLYLVNIEGTLDVLGERLRTRDAMEITEEDLTFRTSENSHFLFVEMAKPEA